MWVSIDASLPSKGFISEIGSEIMLQKDTQLAADGFLECPM